MSLLILVVLLVIVFYCRKTIKAAAQTGETVAVGTSDAVSIWYTKVNCKSYEKSIEGNPVREACVVAYARGNSMFSDKFKKDKKEQKNG